MADFWAGAYLVPGATPGPVTPGALTPKLVKGGSEAGDLPSSSVRGLGGGLTPARQTPARDMLNINQSEEELGSEADYGQFRVVSSLFSCLH